jgi:hypothetical protein
VSDQYESEQHTRDAALWLAALARQFPELTRELAPGRASARGGSAGPRPAPPGQAERFRQERADALLAEQRHGLAVPGHSAAPLRLDVSDAIRDITDAVVELEAAVHARLGLPAPGRAAVPDRLRRIAARLDEIAEHPVLARHVLDETRRLARRCGRALGDTEQVVRVRGRCPWCDSVSLRAFPARSAILCINPACRCADPVCECRADPAYRHGWAEGDWDVLAVSGAELDAAMNAAPLSLGGAR